MAGCGVRSGHFILAPKGAGFGLRNADTGAPLESAGETFPAACCGEASINKCFVLLKDRGFSAACCGERQLIGVLTGAGSLADAGYVGPARPSKEVSTCP
jgi:hypothetical protein